MSFLIINCLRTQLANERFNGLIGQTYGNVKIIDFAESRGNRKRVLVRCLCGNEYSLSESYLRKIKKTNCQRCSQIIQNRGVDGYQDFIEKGEYWVVKKGSDNHFRKMKSEASQEGET